MCLGRVDRLGKKELHSRNPKVVAGVGFRLHGLSLLVMMKATEPAGLMRQYRFLTLRTGAISGRLEFNYPAAFALSLRADFMLRYGTHMN
jgi:hypothetical protein